jgi:hypothetical protein
MIDQIIHYFSTISSLHRALILAGGISIFWLVESAIPLFSFSYHKWKHAGVNLFFTFTTILVNFALAFLLVKAGDYVVYESTVYPGCTEEDCIPILEQLSGLKFKDDFKETFKINLIIIKNVLIHINNINLISKVSSDKTSIRQEYWICIDHS